MSRSRIAKSYLKQAVIQTTLLNYRTFHRNHRKLVIKQSVDKFSLKAQHLAQLHELDELLAFSQKVFTGQQQYLAQRIQELLDLCAEDEEVVASASSLKSMLLFLLKLTHFSPPGMTVSEDGWFHLHWKKDNFYSMTLRFKKNSDLDYAIFLPSQHVDKPIILSGNMNVLDFIEQLIAKNNVISQLVRE